MESNVAAPYSNNYMAILKEDYLHSDPLYIQHAGRFIDDSFCI